MRSDATYAGFWQALNDAYADAMLSGHHRDYEQFVPQAPAWYRQFDDGSSSAPAARRSWYIAEK